MTNGEPQPSIDGLSLLYDELRDELQRFLANRLGDASEAEEVVQDLYLRIRGVAGGSIANGRAYLFRAAQNLALDRARERRRRAAREGDWLCLHHAGPPGVEPADPGADAEAAIVEHEQTKALAAAILALPPGAGRAFRMHKIDGLSHAEIARQLGISRSGVEKHLAVAMAHLRRAVVH